MISIEGSRHIYAIEGIIGIICYQRLKIASKIEIGIFML